MGLWSQAARERGLKVRSAREAVADGLTVHQYVNEAAGVYNPYAVKRGNAAYQKQKQWRNQARIDYITEQQRGSFCNHMVATYDNPNQTAYNFSFCSKHGGPESIRK